MINDAVSILGCGWMGRPLARHLVGEGVHVRGSTTTPEKVATLRDDGIEPYHLTLDPGLTEEEAGAFFTSPVLVLNVPPSRDVEDPESWHLRQIDAVRAAAAAGAVEWIVFVSSTGVYPNVERTVTEEELPPGDPEALPGARRRTGRVLLETEGRLSADPSFATTVVRFGGLYGDDRHPGRFLAGRSDVGRPQAPVNLIHQDDCVALLATLLEEECRGGVFNACADTHPSRKAVYTRAAEALGLEPPSFDDTDTTTGKIVDNSKIKTHCGYQFRHPDPLADLPPAAN